MSTRKSIKSSSYDEMLKQRESVAAILKTIAHESRLMILCLLVKNEMTVSEINEQVKLSQSALSQHLAILRRNNLVETRRKSQTIYYRLADKNLRKIIDSLHNVFCALK